MDFRYSNNDEEFRQEVIKFLKNEAELTEKVRWEIATGVGWGPEIKEFLKRAGARGYLVPDWPVKYGGLGASHLRRHIVAEEMAYHVGRLNAVGISMAGPVLLRQGSERQKEQYLPRIARGEIEFALGYTEPQAGSDLASLQLRARKDENYYILNGQKTFNTSCHYADYHWLAARTDPSLKKHRGISLFIVDFKTPGITIRPLIGLGKIRTNEVFYDDVRIPKDCLVGEENHGWDYVTEALAHERTWLSGENQYEYEQLLQYVKNNKRNGEFLSEDVSIRRDLAQAEIEIEIARLFALRIAYMVNKGTVPTYESSMTKLFGSEAGYRLAALGMKLTSNYAQLDMGSEHAFGGGRPSRLFYNRATRSLITAGTSEIQRNIIAAYIGLPRG